LKASVSVSGSATGASASVETKRENLAEVLTLVAEILQEPSFPETEFEPMRQAWMAGLEQRRSDPQALAVLGMRRHLNPYPKDSVHYIRTLEEESAAVGTLKLEDIRSFYSELYGGSNIELSVVGDFDEKAVEQLVGKLFAGWKSPSKYTRIPSRYFDVPPVNRSIETPDKTNALFLAGLNLRLRDDDPDYAPLVLADYMLGGGFLNSRLASRIRQKEGLSYGVGSQLSASSLDKDGGWLMYAFAAPENMEKLEKVFGEVMDLALKNGFTDEEIQAAKSGLLQSRQNDRADDGTLASMLTGFLFLDRTLEWDKELEKKIEALKEDEVINALRRNIDMKKMSIVKAGDFKKAVASGQEAGSSGN
jgi:zinc protease